MPEIILNAGREKSVLRHHPWIFSGAIKRVAGNPHPGETVDVVSSQGEFLARAAYNPKSNIAGRIWTWDASELVDQGFFEQRIGQAFGARENISGFINADALRLIHGESDGLPGLVLDRYGDIFVVQFLTAGIEFWKDAILDILIRKKAAAAIYERSDVDVRQLEGLPLSNGILYGDMPTNPIVINENDAKFKVDIINGHKTGFYLDQRDNRLLARHISAGKTVLDCFSYTGGFAVNSLLGDAESVILVDSSADALDIAKGNIELNNLPLDRVKFIEQDVFKYLRALRDSGQTFDLVILDPPKFAPTAAQVERAARGYKDINLLAFKVLKPGGSLLTFSCSGGVSEDLFQKIVTGAMLDAECDAVIFKRLHQACDHPVALNFPEGAYLKGFLIQKGYL